MPRAEGRSGLRGGCWDHWGCGWCSPSGEKLSTILRCMQTSGERWEWLTKQSCHYFSTICWPFLGSKVLPSMLWMWLSRIFVNRIFSKICLGSCYLKAKDSKCLSGKMNNHLLFYRFLKAESKKNFWKSGTVLQHHCSVDKIFPEYFATFSSFLRETLDPHLPAYSWGLQSVLFLPSLLPPQRGPFWSVHSYGKSCLFWISFPQSAILCKFDEC